MLSLRLEDLDRPAEETTRRLALALLDDAAVELERLGKGRDSEALHDFRVALRRLRSLLRAYRSHLDGAVSRKMRSRLKELAGATGAGRDTEVQLAWLKARKADLAARYRSGHNWLTRRLETRLDEAYARLHEVLADDFRGLEKTLRRRLAFYRVDVRGKSRPARVDFRSAASERIREHALDLRANADAIHTLADKEALHKARICAKRLRYILEPLAASLEGSGGAVERLKAFQDLLGDLNDRIVMSGELIVAREAAVLEGKAAAAGLSRLAAMVEKDKERLQAAIDSEWLKGQIIALVGGVIELVAALHGERTEGVEIERKFLLGRLPVAVDGMTAWEVDQGWIPGASIDERIRRVRDGKDVRYYRTVKFGKGLRRIELEDELGKEVFESLWRLTRGRRVRKKRYRISENGLVWEIDKFSGRKLILAEVELPSEDTPVEIPAWLAPHVVREVTGVEEYYNVNLAR